MNKKYNLKLDLQFRCNNSIMTFNQFDNNTSDFFIRITNGGKLFDIEKAIVVLAVIKPNKEVDSQFVEVENGVVYANLKPSMKDEIGIYTARAMLILESEKVVTDIVSYEVEEDKIFSLLNDTVETSEEFTLLTDMLSRLSNIETNEEQRMINEAERILSEENRKIEEAKRVEAELIRQHEEADRAKYDATRESNETIRKQNESIRLANETNRIDEEAKRVEEENKRKLAEEERNANYNFMTEDEERRRIEANAHKEAENLRVQAETNRVNEEAKRRTTEQARVSAENTRVNNENARKVNETTRQTNEAKRVEAETQRQNRYNSFIVDAEANANNFENYTNTAKVKEEERKSNELDRKSQEDRRVSNEVERISNENTRKANEEARIESEKQRVNAENLRKEKIIEIQSDYDSLKKIIIDENASVNLQNQINQIDNRFDELQEHCTGGNGMQEHSHINKAILDKLGENENGDLTFNGEEINFEIFNVEYVDGYINGDKIEQIGTNTLCRYTKTYIPIIFIKSLNIPLETTLNGVSYYDVDYNFIQGVKGTSGTFFTSFEDVPSNAYYVRFSHFKSKEMVFEFDEIISKLNDQIIENSNSIVQNTNNINKNANKILELEKSKLKSLNLYNNECELIDGYISNDNYTIKTGFNSKTVIIPVIAGKEYTLNKATVFSSAAIYLLWRGDNGFTSGFTSSSLNWKDANVYDTIYKVATITAPSEANELLITVKFDTYESSTDDLCVCEGDSNKWVGPITVSKYNDKYIYDFYAHEKINKSLYPYASTTLCTFGDSLTDKNTGGYVELMQSKVGCNVINKGSSGSDTKRLVNIVTGNEIKRIENGVTYPAIDYSTIDIVTIMIGTNGALTDNSTFDDVPIIINNTLKTISDGGTITYNDQVISTTQQYFDLFPNNYYGNLSLCIEYILWKNPNIKIYLLVPPPSSQLQLKLDGYAEQVRNAIFEIGRYYGIEVIDTLRECGISIHNISIYTKDNTHMNTLGNEKLGNYFARKIFNC